MKGVKKRDEQKITERNEFVRTMFLMNTKERERHGFIDPPLSAPKAQIAFKKRFGVSMNSQRMYDLRRAAFNEVGLDDKGRPLPNRKPVGAVNGAKPLVAASRTETDPLFHVAVIPLEGEEQGVFLKDALDALAQRGLVADTLKIDAITERYATVSNFPK